MTKRENYSFRVLFLAVAFALANFANAQTINIGPNQYAFQYTSNPNFGLFFNAADGRYEFRNGSAASIFGIDASSGSLTSDLSFESGNDLLIGDNSYAFRSATNSNFGLYFNSVALQYQFLNGSAAPIFAINANNGRFDSNIQFNSGKSLLVAPGNFALRSAAVPDAGIVFGTSNYEFRGIAGTTIFSVNVSTGDAKLTGGLSLGSSTLEEAGRIRYNGGDFEGYDGVSWISFTEGLEGPVGPQGPSGVPGPQGIAGAMGAVGPQGPAGLLPAGSTDAVPYFDGTNWQVGNTGIINNGNEVGIGISPDSNTRLLVEGLSPEIVQDKSVIRANRPGSSAGAGPLDNWTDADAAIRGEVNWGNSYSAGVYGQSFLDYANSASVLGTLIGGQTYGALAYKDATNTIYAGYFKGNVKVDGRITPNSVVATAADDVTFGALAYTAFNGTLYAGYFNGDIAVDGQIRSKSVVVTLDGFPDYVFKSNYDLMPLSEVESFIKEYGHLPNMPSEAEVVENGLGLGEINIILVEKVEELTLHLIEKEKDVQTLTVENKELKERMDKLEALMNQIISE